MRYKTCKPQLASMDSEPGRIFQALLGQVVERDGVAVLNAVENLMAYIACVAEDSQKDAEALIATMAKGATAMVRNNFAMTKAQMTAPPSAASH